MTTSFLKTYRKAQRSEQTHFCPGCGHGNLLKCVDLALTRLACAERTIWVSPVGCGGLTDAYMSVSHVLSPHGRASAVGTAIKRLEPEQIVIVSQGDGDFASIGLAESLHAANRCENLSVFVVNNANFGMTGGQMAATTLVGQRTTTSLQGRSLAEEGAPLKLCEMLQSLDGPVFIARVAFGNARQLAEAEKVIERAIEYQLLGKGYAFVEILSPCPSNWHMSPSEARRHVAQEMTKFYPTGIFRDVSREERLAQRRRPEVYDAKRAWAVIEDMAGPVLADHGQRGQLLTGVNDAHGQGFELSIWVSGSGGQGVLTLGRLLASLAVSDGFYATWLPSYGAEKRGGQASCTLRIGSADIVSPCLEQASHAMVLSAVGMENLEELLVDGAVVVYDADLLSLNAKHRDIRCFGVHATQIAADLGQEHAVNIIVLAAFLRHSALAHSPEALIEALQKLMQNNVVIKEAFWAGWEACVV